MATESASIEYDKKDSELAKAVWQGTIDFFQWNAENSPLPEKAWQEGKNAICYCFGINYAPCNGVFEKGLRRIPEKEIFEACEFFNHRRLPFIWWTSDQNLEVHGFEFGGILTGIGMDISQGPPSAPEVSKKVTIKIVQSSQELASFSEIAVKASGIPDSTLEQFHKIFAEGMESGQQLHFLAYVDEIPAATATLSLAGQTAGVWNLATLEKYRRQGLGGALVHAAVAEAYKRQYHYVMAVLMPKGMAWGLFTKLGFVKVCDFPFYIYGASADELEK